MEYGFLLSSIENILGKSHKRARDNYAFTCPFCNHRKPKLEINLRINEKGQNPWECWVCETKGRTIKALLRKLKLSKNEAQEVLKYLPEGSQDYTVEHATVSLPDEFQPIITASTTSVVANTVRNYLYRRGLDEYDFIRYNIGYCTKGEYSGRIIIPSYNDTGNLNFFIGRTFENSFYKYRNPESSKDIIFFENLINWELPIVLCEGVFDAMAIKRNAIPILGKSLSDSLYTKIVTSPVQDIYICLDYDARKKALYISEKLQAQGKTVYLVDLPEKDPSEMGFEKITKHISNAEELDLTNLLAFKLDL